MKIHRRHPAEYRREKSQRARFDDVRRTRARLYVIEIGCRLDLLLRADQNDECAGHVTPTDAGGAQHTTAAGDGRFDFRVGELFDFHASALKLDTNIGKLVGSTT